MKILIIGSKGFLGSHFVNYFEKKSEVYKCDVQVDYTASNYFLVDATNADYNDIFQNNSFDFCINCSGAANVSDSITNPHRDFLLNTVNVFKQLDAIRKHNNTCKYINMSSAAVYGNPKKLPISENAEIKPISPYGEHKRMAEEICAEFHSYYGISTCSLRIFSAYGPGLHKQLFWDIFRKYKQEGKISLFGTGNETRDFIFIDDILKAVDIIIEKSQFNGEQINIAAGQEIKIKDAAMAIGNLLRDNITVEFNGQTKAGDPLYWKADITRLKELGFSTNVTLEEGLKTTVAEYLKFSDER